MKLYFAPSALPWQPERYHYAAEQMMLTLFPGEKPEYPREQPNTNTEDCALFSLCEDAGRAVLTARAGWKGRCAEGSSTLALSELDAAPEQVYHVVQHALKMAFYAAGKQLLGIQPPWGALTGVRPVKLPTREMKRGATPEQARQALEQRYDVTPVRSRLATDCARASLAVDESLHSDEVSVYLGVPFCPTRCAYCSFVSADVGRTLKLVEPYVQAVLEEIDATAAALRQAGLHIRSFYMGGGTPTTLSAQQMDRVLTRCESVLPLERCTEYTVEAGRPDTITREKLEVLRRHDIDRISINPQTLEDHVLAGIGRKHSADDIRRAYELAREVGGFSCINMDLIAGLPRDSYEGFCRSLEGVLAMGPENITVHTLALKKGSTLMERRDLMPSGEEVERMLDFSLHTLRGQGCVPYYLYRQKYMSGSLENVGWTKPGLASVYNIVMMEELHTVVSIGGGGVTKLVDPARGKILRLPNPKFPHDYLATRDKVLEQKHQIPAFYRGMREETGK